MGLTVKGRKVKGGVPIRAPGSKRVTQVREGGKRITRSTARSSAVNHLVAQYCREGPLAKNYWTFRACDSESLRGGTSSSQTVRSYLTGPG